MKIATLGKGNIGGGLGEFWEKAGHDVTKLGSDGGDVSGAEVVLVAVPGGAVGDALNKAQGIEGKLAIDATNLVGAEPPDGFASNAEYVKSRTGGPTAKAFNLNFANIYDRLGEPSKPPGNVWCGDDEAREAVEQLCRDAGFEPIYAGPLENAAMQEAALGLMFAINQGGMGPFFYRAAPPDRL
jgi:8-hydroxy-5-deazaflavin:NADPH oxidoreductase